MKKMLSLAAMFAALSYASPAFADANVNVYGTLDAAAGYVNHQLSVDPQFPGSVNPVSPVKTSVPSSVSGLFNGGISPSRGGIKGGADICEGKKVFFTLEEGFNLPTGEASNAAAALAANGGTATTLSANSSVNNQLFNRQAFVGISDTQLGSLAIGRNYAPIYDICVSYDPVQNSGLFSPLGFSGSYGGGGGLSEDARVENSLKYSNKVGSFNFGALYKFGNSSVGDGATKSAYALNAGYEEGNFGIQATYQAFQDALKGGAGSAVNTVALTNYNTTSWMAAAKYKVTKDATLKIGYEQFTLGAPSDQLNTTAGSSLFVSNYYGQAISGLTNFSSADQTTHIVFGGGDYNFSDKFNLAAGIYDVRQHASADLKQTANGLLFLSLLADYHLTKSFDTYAGIMYASYSGATYGVSANYYPGNTIAAVGVRYKF